ncbi:conjugal transfer protein [Alicyclobacillus fodiniaquatilis]|uniref:Conjugal transfer protein n=1 Tax=Alicyclobacillus fodiniaquatilis TaxID=1661150 RepID=A0ABW4JJJ3_9BACL
MEAQVIRRARWKTAGRAVLWTVLVIVGARGVVSIFKSPVAHPSTSAHLAHVTPTMNPVSDGAKTEAVLFVQQWLTVNGKQTPQDWTKNLQSYITPSFAADMQKSMPVTWQVPKSVNGKKKPASVPDPNLSVVEANVWDSRWLKAGSEALVTVRTETSDHTLWYLSVPVVKVGGTWRVNHAPALLPHPQNPSADTGNPVMPTLSTQTSKQVQATLESFSRAWLTGDTNTAERYMVHPVPATNEMQSIGGQVKSVRFTTVSSDPLVVNTTVGVATHNMIMDFSYLVTMVKQNGQYFIQAIDSSN